MSTASGSMEGAACPTCRKPGARVTPGQKVFVNANCPVCLEDASPVIALRCGHVLCVHDYETMFGIDVDGIREASESIGGYTIVAETASKSATVSLESEYLGDLQQGSYVNVTEARYVEADDRVRAKLFDGSWISLVNTATNHRWAAPIATGGYTIIAETASRSATVSLDSEESDALEQGSYVNVTEARYVEADDQVRGQLSDGSWISLVNTATNHRWAAPIATGGYTIIAETASRSATVSVDSEESDALEQGCYVNVTEARYVEADYQVRARLSDGSWISLVNTATNHRWAAPIATGGYTIIAETASRSATVSLDSEYLGDLVEESHVIVTEVRYVAADERVRARLSDGRWISLVNTATNHRWAELACRC